jgi:8-oxo-dGTP diphosphatase
MANQEMPIEVVAAVIEREDRFLLTRRLVGRHLGGYWEFPGGKCHAGEDHKACLAREIREELDTGVDIGPRILSTTHAYPEKVVALHFYACSLVGAPRAVLGQEMRWVRREELERLRLPPADRKLVERLRRE